MKTPIQLREPQLPPAAPLGTALDRILGLVLFALGLCLPYSIAGVNILWAVLLVIALAAFPLLWRSAPWRDPIVACSLLLFSFIAVHTFATTSQPREALEIVKRYDELPILAVLVALLRASSRSTHLLWGLLLGTVGYAIAYWAAPVIPLVAGKTQSGYIAAGFTLGVSAWLFTELGSRARRPTLFYAAAAFLTLTIILRVQGRTGLVILVVLAACTAWTRLPRRWRLAGILILPAAVFGLSMKMGAVSARVLESGNALQSNTATVNDSTRIRVEMLYIALDLVKENYLGGVGLSNYAEANRKAAAARDLRESGQIGPERPWTSTGNPHNEYLFQLAGGGVVGLGLFLAWLGLPLLRQKTGHPDWIFIVPALAFATGCIFNSMLRDFTEGHYYVVLLAWLLANGHGRLADVRRRVD